MEHAFLSTVISDVVHWCPLITSEEELDNVNGNLAQTVFHFMSMKNNSDKVKRTFWSKHKENVHKRVNRMRCNYANSLSHEFQGKPK